MPNSLLIFFLVTLLVISGFFSGSETALFSLSSMKINLFRKDVSYRKRLVARLVSKPKELLVTILLINVAVNIAIQNLISSVFGTYSSWLLTVGLPLILTLLFGEAIPKSLAISHNVTLSTRASPILYFAQVIVGPIRIFLTLIANIISRCIFFFLRREREISIEELKHALKTSTERGIVSQDEAKLIIGSLKIDEIVAKEIMQPRQEIICFDVEEPLEKLLHIFVDEECSKVPVISKTLDNILGIITSDIYFLHQKEIQNAFDLRQFVKEPFFIPEMSSIRRVLAGFHAKNETIAMIVDEYGQISGLITYEDIVESVIGQIADKRDEKVLYTRQSDDVIIADGKLELQILEDIFDVSCESEGAKITIGGWLTDEIGDIPKSGSKHVTKDLLCHVLSATPTRVELVYIRRLRQNKKKEIAKKK